MKLNICVLIFCIFFIGCAKVADSKDIVKIIDFELSPDENKIAFSASTPVGNTDIWVVDIDGSNLKKLSFKDHSPSNHIARFFKKHKWRNFYVIDMSAPEWTKDGRIAFCEEITQYQNTGIRTAAVAYQTMKTDGSDKRPKTQKDEIVRRKPFDPINRAIISEESKKNKKKFFLTDGILWVLDYEKSNPEKLIR